MSTEVSTRFNLSQWASCGGCAAKWGGADLSSLVGSLGMAAHDGGLLVGLAPFDDAAVYRVDDTTALVSTTDFFPPLVEDPADFGAIAAANACSDVFAMGGRVALALNIAAFPETLPPEVVAAILGAAAEVVAEAGGQVAGGHTIRSDDLIFGLAVQGFVHPDRIWTKAGAQPGDTLVLSKPIGSGIVLAGAGEVDKAAAVRVMRTLNRRAAEQLGALDGVHAVTDVTGFGLAGHAWEMAERSRARVQLDLEGVPFYSGARQAARAGVRTGGDPRNRAYLAAALDSSVAEDLEALALDPQTSGGLLAAVTAPSARVLAATGWSVVGSVDAGEPSVVLR
jgi:selenide, water dikinase